MGWDYSHIYHSDNLGRVRVVAHRGRVVCTTGIHVTTVRTPAGTVRVGGVNAVATEPEHRKAGLASAVLHDVAQTMRSEGLHVGLLGTGIPEWYRKQDWEFGGRQWSFSLDRGNVDLLPDPGGFAVEGIEISEAELRMHRELLALYEAHGLGATRTLEQFTLLALRKLPRCFVARRGGTVLAYLGVMGSAVREYGGDPEAVARLLRAVFHHLDDRSASTSTRPPGGRAALTVQVQTPVSSDGFPGLLHSLGLPCSLGYQGMIRILDAPGLFGALGLGPIDAAESGWRVPGAARTLTPHELVKAVFGPERIPGLPADRFPAAFYQWPADRV
jgi:hypothetical protein